MKILLVVVLLILFCLVSTHVHQDEQLTEAVLFRFLLDSIENDVEKEKKSQETGTFVQRSLSKLKALALKTLLGARKVARGAKRMITFPKNPKKAYAKAFSKGQLWASKMGPEVTSRLLDALAKAKATTDTIFTPGSFSNDDKEAVRVAANAYHFKNVFRVHGYVDLETYSKNNDTQLAARTMISIDGKSVMLGFAGTQSFQDVKADLNGLGKKEFLGLGPVYPGFYAEYKKVRAALIEDLKLLIENGLENIVVSGHSLGGAQAFLAAAELKHLYPNLHVRVVTVGAPAVGGKKFVQSYDALNIPTTRYENGRDIVTRLAQALGWNHVGQAINLKSPASKAMQMLVAKVHIIGMIIEGIRSGSQHVLANYMNKMEALVDLFFK